MAWSSRAEVRREHFVRGVSVKELARRTGLSRNTRPGGTALVRAAGPSVRTGRFEARSVQGPDPSAAQGRARHAGHVRPAGARVRSSVWTSRAGKTIVDDLRDSRSAGICAKADPAGQGRRRALAGLRRALVRARARVRERAGLPTATRHLVRRARQRPHPQDAESRPIDRLIDKRRVMAPLPPVAPGTDRRWVLRVAPDPYLRVDSCDYSLDLRRVGRRVEVKVSERKMLAVALDTGELACRLPRSFARNRTITALEHARPLKAPARTPPEPRRASGRGALARDLRPADRMSRPTTELADGQPERVGAIRGEVALSRANAGLLESTHA